MTIILSLQVSSLEERYGGENAGGGSRKKGKRGKRANTAPAPDMDDDEFERIQRDIMKGRSKP